MEFETEGKIASAMRLCCGEGGLITDHMTLDIMNGAPGGTFCPACGGEDILWTAVDGTRTITTDGEDGTRFYGTYLDMDGTGAEPFKGRIRARQGGPAVTLNEFRNLTREVPGDTYLTVYSDEHEYRNLRLTEEDVDAMRPEDGQPSLIFTEVGYTDTCEF